MKKSLLFITAILAVAVAFITFGNIDQAKQSYTPRDTSSTSMSAKGAAEHYNMLRANPSTGIIDQEAMLKASQAIERMSINNSSRVQDYNWTSLGPDNVGGRTRAIYVDKDNTQLIYIGSVTGGLFKSINGGSSWERMQGFNDNSAISSVTKIGNGTIYVGTGSSYEGAGASNLSSGIRGHGLFKSTDNGDSFSKVFSPSELFAAGPWSIVDEVRADPFNNDIVWIAHTGGLSKYNDATGELIDVLDTPVKDFDISSSTNDGNKVHIIALKGNRIRYSHDAHSGIFGEVETSLSSVTGRAVVAISPDDPNFMYFSTTTGGSLKAIFASMNGGTTFKKIVDGSSAIFGTGGVFGSNTQGAYDNALTVIPGKPGSIIQGGIATWRWDMNVPLSTPFNIAGTTLYQYSILELSGGDPDHSIHSDIHTFTWDKNGILYIGCDGGVYRSYNPGSASNTFYPINYNYVTGQFYKMDYSKNGAVAGGMQDNGTKVIIGGGNTTSQGFPVMGGDGFSVAFSKYNNTLFAATQYNSIGKATFTDGGQGTGFEMLTLAAGSSGDNVAGTFHSFFAFYENPDEWMAPWNYQVILTQNVAAGEVVNYTSASYNYPMSEIVSENHNAGDTLMLKDKFQSLFAYGRNGHLYLGRDAVNNQADSLNSWAHYNIGGKPLCFEYSQDGNELYVGTSSGRIYRIKDLRTAYSQSALQSLGAELIYQSSSAPVTGLALDPNDQERLLASRGAYNSSQHIIMTTTAMSAGAGTNEFVGIWDDFAEYPGLDNMPAYSVVVDKNNPGTVLAGTEWGVFKTTDFGASGWEEANTGDMYRVPVYDMKQQIREGAWNNGVVYAGTFGGGIFSAGDYVLGVNDNVVNSTVNNNLFIYPNPTQDYANIDITLEQDSKVILDIFSITGVKIRSINQGVIRSGKNTLEFDVTDMATGSYIANIKIEGQKSKIAKFVVTR